MPNHRPAVSLHSRGWSSACRCLYALFKTKCTASAAPPFHVGPMCHTNPCSCNICMCVCVFVVGQQRLQVDYQGLTDRVVKADKQHASFASQLQQSASYQNQLKATLRNVQRQAGATEVGQAKLQQEVTDLGQAVEQMKGRKGPALPWQRSQEQVVQTTCCCFVSCQHLQMTWVYQSHWHLVLVVSKICHDAVRTRICIQSPSDN